MTDTPLIITLERMPPIEKIKILCGDSPALSAAAHMFNAVRDQLPAAVQAQLKLGTAPEQWRYMCRTHTFAKQCVDPIAMQLDLVQDSIQRLVGGYKRNKFANYAYLAMAVFSLYTPEQILICETTTE